MFFNLVCQLSLLSLAEWGIAVISWLSCLNASTFSAFIKPIIASHKTIAKGKAIAMVIVCSAFKPPANNNIAATTPMPTAQ